MKQAGTYERLIDRVTQLIYEADPSLMDRYGEKGVQKCKDDNAHHMRHLETALELGDSRVFSDYAVWLNGILNTYGMRTRTLTDNFRYLQQSLSTVDELDEPTKRAFGQYLTDAINRLEADQD